MNPRILDAHIHLWPLSATNRPSIAWMPDRGPATHPATLHGYLAATTDSPESIPGVTGFIHIEADRTTSPGADLETHCAQPLSELAFLRRVFDSQPDLADGEREGFDVADVPSSALLRAAVIWAPLDRGPEAVSWYLTQARDVAGSEIWGKVRGVRFLMQGIRDEMVLRELMLSPAWMEGLRVLREWGLLFEIGIDIRSAGIWQLVVAREMVERLRMLEEYGDVDEDERIRFVIDHLCKPNLHLSASEASQHADLGTYRNELSRMASLGNVSVKLSGALSELPTPADPSHPPPLSTLIAPLKPWLDAVFTIFTPSQIFFGSDWPVCTFNGFGSSTWRIWRDAVALILEERGLSTSERADIWAGTAERIYRISTPPDSS